MVLGGALAVVAILAGQPRQRNILAAGYDLRQAVGSTLDLPPLLPELNHDLNHPDTGDLAGSFVRHASYAEGTAGQNALAPVTPATPAAGAAESASLLKIGRGQSFYDALAARGANHDDILELVKTCKPFRNLRAVRSGEVFRVEVGPGGRLQSLGFDLDEESFVTWVREGDTYVREDGTYPVERRYRGVNGTIRGSLAASLAASRRRPC